jgi:hexosaminidase
MKRTPRANPFAESVGDLAYTLQRPLTSPWKGNRMAQTELRRLWLAFSHALPIRLLEAGLRMGGYAYDARRFIPPAMRRLPFSAFCSVLLVFCATGAVQSELTQQVLPKPRCVALAAGSLVLTKTTSLNLDAGAETVGGYFAERLRRGTGWPVPVVTGAEGTLCFRIVAQPPSSDSAGKAIPPDGYSVQIAATGACVRAASPAGLARGAETLLQLMPATVYGSSSGDRITLPALTIEDGPHFPWRGAMLDVSRKFQGRDTILKLLEGLAACKLNVFHWHLTDDQGWRLPIEGYPKLTEKGPAYSRGDIRDVVRRAAELGITIVPEVDMPGHSGASCQAYPEIAVRKENGQPTGTMNPGAESAYTFIEAVMKDLAAQFPDSPFVHIGADEVGSVGWSKDAQCQALMKRENLKSAHELYVYFVNRAVAIARQHGKRSIAWDEAFDAKNDPSLIIMSWRGMAPGIAAAKVGRTVIFAPNPPLYINHANTRSRNNPRAYSAHPSYLNQCYFVYPDTPAIPPENRALVLGAEICLWGECVTDARYMFTHVFPRASAVAENLWVTRGELDWKRFLGSLVGQNSRFNAMSILYFWEPETLPASPLTWKPAEKGVAEFPLDLRHAGEQEFFVTQGTGEGQYRVDAVELLKDGITVDADRHPCDASVYRNVDCVYVVKNPDTAGHYTVRVTTKALFGDSTAMLQHIPALPPDGYSMQCVPGSGANRTKQSPAVPAK